MRLALLVACFALARPSGATCLDDCLTRFGGTGPDYAACVTSCGVCGNGVLEGDEECDDGNTVGGDCCDATCHFEPTADHHAARTARRSHEDRLQGVGLEPRPSRPRLARVAGDRAAPAQRQRGVLGRAAQLPARAAARRDALPGSLRCAASGEHDHHQHHLDQHQPARRGRGPIDHLEHAARRDRRGHRARRLVAARRGRRGDDFLWRRAGRRDGFHR